MTKTTCFYFFWCEAKCLKRRALLAADNGGMENLPTWEEGGVGDNSCTIQRAYATVSSFGATLISLWVPDRHGCVGDVVLGYKILDAYESRVVSMGQTAGS
eukprot:s1043_g22.t1